MFKLVAVQFPFVCFLSVQVIDYEVDIWFPLCMTHPAGNRQTYLSFYTHFYTFINLGKTLSFFFTTWFSIFFRLSLRLLILILAIRIKGLRILGLFHKTRTTKLFHIYLFHLDYLNSLLSLDEYIYITLFVLCLLACYERVINYYV